MIKATLKPVLNVSKLSTYKKYISQRDRVLLTEKGLFNFDKQLFIPAKEILEGYPIVFSGEFLKKLISKVKNGKTEIQLTFSFGNLHATVKLGEEEIIDFRPEIVPELEINIPSKEGTKPVNRASLELLKLFNEDFVSFDGEFAYVKTWRYTAKIPNPFVGLKGVSIARPQWKTLNLLNGFLTWKIENNHLYVFNSYTFMQELDQFEPIKFPEEPTQGWFKVNPSLLLEALNSVYFPENGTLKVEKNTLIFEFEETKRTIPIYGNANFPPIMVRTGLISALEKFKNFSLIEIAFYNNYLFLKNRKLVLAVEVGKNSVSTEFWETCANFQS